MLAIEGAAEERGYERAHLDTLRYQARAFYEKLGYRMFGELEDYPPGTLASFCANSSGPRSRGSSISRLRT